jgi:hypothetical protein
MGLLLSLVSIEIAGMSKVVSLSVRREKSWEQDSEQYDDEHTSTSSQIALNKMCSSLITKDNQKRFRAFPEFYCREYGLSLEQIHAVTDLDIMRLLNLGGLVPNLEKLTRTYGLEILNLCVEQTGKTTDEVKAILPRT